MTYYIDTYQNGKQLLGSDYSRIVRNCKTHRKHNAVNAMRKYLLSLSEIKPELKNEFDLVVTPKIH